MVQKAIIQLRMGVQVGLKWARTVLRGGITQTMWFAGFGVHVGIQVNPKR